MLFKSTVRPSACACAANALATPLALPVCEPNKMVRVAAGIATADGLTFDDTPSDLAAK